MRPHGLRRSSCEYRAAFYSYSGVADWILNANESNARGTSTLHLQVSAERKYVKDDYVGELEENIQSLLASANNGGHHSLSCPLSKF